MGALTEADAAWAAQLGPALSDAGASQLLGLHADDVREAPGLLRLRQREPADWIYPLFQFTTDGQVPGVAEVVTLLSTVFGALTIASWLTSRNSELDRARPIDVLRAGGTDRVLRLARELSADASG